MAENGFSRRLQHLIAPLRGAWIEIDIWIAIEAQIWIRHELSPQRSSYSNPVDSVRIVIGLTRLASFAGVEEAERQ